MHQALQWNAMGLASLPRNFSFLGEADSAVLQNL